MVRILKALFSFIPCIIEFLWFSKLWLKFEEKIHTKAILNLSSEKLFPHVSPPPIPFAIPLDNFIHYIYYIYIIYRGVILHYFQLLAWKLTKFLTQLLCIFLAQTLHTFDKSSPSKCKFSDFRLLPWKLTNFLTLFFRPPVSFSLNIATTFSVMTHNSFVIF